MLVYSEPFGGKRAHTTVGPEQKFYDSLKKFPTPNKNSRKKGEKDEKS
jgi:hypothetical protein